MLKKEHRLSKSRDIESVVRGGVRVRMSNIVMYIVRTDTGMVRVACIAGKKVHKDAVVRHAVQRKLRAACKEVVILKPGSYDMVVVAQTSAIKTMNVQDMVRDISQAMPSV